MILLLYIDTLLIGVINLNQKLSDLEKEIKLIDDDAYNEEKKNAVDNYAFLDNELSNLENCKPYPSTPKFKSVLDDKLIDYREERNKLTKHIEKIENIKKYVENGSLYIGHIHITSRNHDVYFTDSDLGSYKFGDKKYLINVHSAEPKQKELIKLWREPKPNADILFSRSIEMENRNINLVEIIMDKRSLYFTEIQDNHLRRALLRNKNKIGINKIINTIQAKQDEIRTLAPKSPIIVQGCAGSGKTMILLYRIKYLLFNHMVSPNEYVLLLPSIHFKYFISDFLSDYHIPDNNVFTYYEYYQHFQGKKIKQKEENELVFSNEYLNVIYSENFFKEIYIDFSTFFHKQVKSLINLLSIKYQNMKNNKTQNLDIFIEWYKEIEIIISNNSKNLTPISNTLIECYKKVSELLKMLSNSISEEENNIMKNECHFLLKSSEKTFSTSLKKQLFKIVKEKIKKRFNININPKYKHYWYLSLYCYYLIEPDINIKSKVNFLIIDEAQDLSKSEIELLNKINTLQLTEKRKSEPLFNFFGDINQSISEHCLKDWNEISFAKNNYHLYKLNENFRNTNQIVQLCNKTFSFKMQEVGIDMENVDYYNTVEDITYNHNSKIFIIKDEYSKIDLQYELKKTKIDKYEIYTVKEVKGLEFKEIYVIDTDMTENERYVSYTRALQKLNIIKSLPNHIDHSTILYDESSQENEEEIE